MISSIFLEVKKASIRIKNKINPLGFALIFVFSTILITLILYALFTARYPSIDYEIYQPGLPLNEVNKINDDIIKPYARSLDHTPEIIFSAITIAICFILFIYLLARKKLTFLKALILIFVVGFAVRFSYAMFTDNICVRQHDVWDYRYYGHFGITTYIYKNGKIPMPFTASDGSYVMNNSYQLYHPKFAYLFYALTMKINSALFATDEIYFLYESLRILTISISCIITYISYLIFKELLTNKKSILIATFVVSVSPTLIMFSSYSNNDPFVWLFAFLAVYFCIKWWKNQKVIYVISLALSIGLSMGSKLSAVLLALPIGILMIIRFVEMIKQKRFKILFLNLVVFAIIVFPVGLLWPVFQYLKYGQPINYVWSNIRGELKIHESFSYFDKYISLGFDRIFTSIYIQNWVWNPNDIATQDYNLYISLVKSSLFGEHSYNVNSYASIFALLAYISQYIIIISLSLLAIYGLLRAILNKQYQKPLIILFYTLLYFSIVFLLMYPKNKLGLFIFFIPLILAAVALYYILKTHAFKDNITFTFFNGIAVLFLACYLYFNVNFEYGCTHNMRYVAILYLPMAYYVSKLFSFVTSSKNSLFKKSASSVLVSVSTIFVVSILCMYTFAIFYQNSLLYK